MMWIKLLGLHQGRLLMYVYIRFQYFYKCNCDCPCAYFLTSRNALAKLQIITRIIMNLKKSFTVNQNKHTSWRSQGKTSQRIAESVLTRKAGKHKSAWPKKPWLTDQSTNWGQPNNFSLIFEARGMIENNLAANLYYCLLLAFVFCFVFAFVQPTRQGCVPSCIKSITTLLIVKIIVTVTIGCQPTLLTCSHRRTRRPNPFTCCIRLTVSCFG